jgi:hypothetical protein
MDWLGGGQRHRCSSARARPGPPGGAGRRARSSRQNDVSCSRNLWRAHCSRRVVGSTCNPVPRRSVGTRATRAGPQSVGVSRRSPRRAGAVIPLRGLPRRRLC